MHQDRPHNERSEPRNDWEDAPNRRCAATIQLWEGSAPERCIRPTGHYGRHQVFGDGDKDAMQSFIELAAKHPGPIDVEGEKNAPSVSREPLGVVRERLVRAALSYAASSLGDVTSAYYDAELEMNEETLNQAARDFVRAVL